MGLGQQVWRGTAAEEANGARRPKPAAAAARGRPGAPPARPPHLRAPERARQDLRQPRAGAAAGLCIDERDQRRLAGVKFGVGRAARALEEHRVQPGAQGRGCGSGGCGGGWSAGASSRVAGAECCRMPARAAAPRPRARAPLRRAPCRGRGSPLARPPTCRGRAGLSPRATRCRRPCRRREGAPAGRRGAVGGRPLARRAVRCGGGSASPAAAPLPLPLPPPPPSARPTSLGGTESPGSPAGSAGGAASAMALVGRRAGLPGPLMRSPPWALRGRVGVK
jgi:hypothetical protein